MPHRYVPALLALLAAPALAQGTSTVRLNEIRRDQPETTDPDEYVEIAGPPGTSLAGYTFLAIDDASTYPPGEGVVEDAFDFPGFLSIPADGYLLFAEDDNTFGAAADWVGSFVFENTDTVTYLLVQGFTGAVGQDLDTNDDGTLDVAPWTAVVDAVSFVDTGGADQHTAYADDLGGTNVPASGGFAPRYALRNSTDGAWVAGPYEPAAGVDTPGASNAVVAGEAGPGRAGAYRLRFLGAHPSRAPRLELTVADPQPVRAEAFDVLGRRVAVLFDGVAAGPPVVLGLPDELPAGRYVVRVAGARFVGAQPVTLTR